MSAHHLSRILGTEEDKVNCPFFFKIGACRHMERCSRVHLRPHFSQTIMIPHMYHPPVPIPSASIQRRDRERERERERDRDRYDRDRDRDRPDRGDRDSRRTDRDTEIEEMEFFVNFYKDVIQEVSKYGEIDEFYVVSNMGMHMYGNVYIKYHDESDAEVALQHLKDRYYFGRSLKPEYSPVTDFREARCGMYEEEQGCTRGDYCNFVHVHPVPREYKYLIHDINYERRKERKLKERENKRRRTYSRSRSRSRSISPPRSRDDERKENDIAAEEEKSIKSEAEAEAATSPSSSAPTSALTDEQRRAKFASLNAARRAKQQQNQSTAADTTAIDDNATRMHESQVSSAT